MQFESLIFDIVWGRWVNFSIQHCKHVVLVYCGEGVELVEQEIQK